MAAESPDLPGLCRDCFAAVAASDRRCRCCRGPRLLRHPELETLSIAHVDCDAFYAAVEKRDNPALRDRPVIVGGARRGVVATACYVARIRGVRSAMPMFKALQLCPGAAVIAPDMAKYAAVGRQVRALLGRLTPLVEPLSIDEAFLDLSGTARLHGASPAAMLARFARDVERELGITVSVGLSYNKFLAKVASDLDKPRGFSVLGRAEAPEFLRPKPVSLVWGVGRTTQQALGRDGIRTLGQIQSMAEADLVRRYGSLGAHLFHLARGEDPRPVAPETESKQISAETTFDSDLADRIELERILWQLAGRVSARAKTAGQAGATVVLKLKTADFRLRTRQVRLDAPTQLADRMFKAARALLEREADGSAFRLIGIGLARLCDGPGSAEADLLDPGAGRRAGAERAMDRVRARFGAAAVDKGIGFTARQKPPAE